MLRTTRWRPDTCSCIIEYEWDDTQSEDVRTHSAKTIVSSCPEHTSLQVDKNNHFGKVLNENQRVNRVASELKTFSSLVNSVLQDDGTTQIAFKKNVIINKSWSGSADNRILTISVTGITLTQQQKDTAQAWCDTNIGVGLVIIQ